MFDNLHRYCDLQAFANLACILFETPYIFKSMKPQELQDLMKQGEGPAIEFKTSGTLSDNFALAREMVAIANSMGGRILIGVRNDGSLEGMRQLDQIFCHIFSSLFLIEHACMF